VSDALKKLQCDYFDSWRCRSCNLLEHDLATISKLKVENLLAALKSQNLLDASIEALFTPSTIFPSRAKAKMAVGGTSAEPIIGLTKKDFSIEELLTCPLQFSLVNNILTALRGLIKKYQLCPYDIGAKAGELKFIIITTNHTSTEAVVRLVIRSKKYFSELEVLTKELQAQFCEVKVVTANIQPLHAAILEGEEELVITSNQYIWEKFANIELCFSAKTFSQVTPEVANALYQDVSSKFKTYCEGRTVLDLFCGVGGFSLFCAPYAKSVTGVELSSNAIECAKLAANRNQSSNTEFICADVEQYLTGLAPKKFDAVITNPPRRGLSPAILQSLLKLEPRQIIYSSCNVQTLCRDLKVLKSKYKIQSLKPFDMFPLTEHLETVAELILE
jgi:23S rRNA (uracil747-C5)-methyltransferase